MPVGNPVPAQRTTGSMSPSMPVFPLSCRATATRPSAPPASTRWKTWFPARPISTAGAARGPAPSPISPAPGRGRTGSGRQRSGLPLEQCDLSALQPGTRLKPNAGVLESTAVHAAAGGHGRLVGLHESRGRRPFRRLLPLADRVAPSLTNAHTCPHRNTPKTRLIDHAVPLESRPCPQLAIASVVSRNRSSAA